MLRILKGTWADVASLGWDSGYGYGDYGYGCGGYGFGDGGSSSPERAGYVENP